MKEPRATPIVGVILYVKDIPKVADFYQRHFGLKPLPSKLEGWLVMETAPGGFTVALHQAAVSQKSGAAMKIVFGVADVYKFVRERAENGLKFGPVHETGQYEFSNAKDPAGNSISVSSRGLK
jgi:predicted enzyme related to lactoylglutathione lyase